MPSENNHIDNFLRNKASEAAIDASHADADWQQMKELLVKPSIVPSKPRTRLLRFRRYLPYAAGVIMVVTTVTIMIAPGKKNSRKSPFTSHTVATKKSIPARKNNTTTTLTAVPTGVATKQLTATNHPSSRKKQTGNPVAQNLKRKASTSLVSKSVVKKEPETGPVIAAVKPDSKTIFNNFYTQLKRSTQEFVIDSRADTTILCNEGSTLFIPAGAFQTIAGLAITGTVRISVQEFYNFADIISNKLSTTSNSMPLETGGMLSINASADDKEVQIRPGSSLDLKMPTRSFDPQMQLFTGQQRFTLMDTVKASLPSAFNMEVVGDTARVRFDNAKKDTMEQNSLRFASGSPGIDWAPAGQQQLFFNEAKKLITVLDLQDNPYTVRTGLRRTVAKFEIPYYCKLSTSEIRSQLEKKYGRFYDVIKVSRAWKPLRKKNRHETINDWYSGKMVGDSISIPLALAARLKLITREDSVAYEATFLRRYQDAVKQKRSYDELLQKRNDYNFKISNLGWINCDRFLSYPRSRLTDYTLTAGSGFEGTYFQAIMIFEKERAVMQGSWNNGQVRFVNLPVGHTVHVICAGVKDGKMQASMQTFVVDKFEKPQLQFEETDPEKFRQKLAYLGDVKSL